MQLALRLVVLGVLLPCAVLAQPMVTISGQVTDRQGQPVSHCDVIFNPSSWIGDDSLYFKCDAEGRYLAEIPAGHYNSMYSLDLPEYGKTQLEFWGWNLQFVQDEVIDIAFDTIEVYSLSVWASNGGSQSIFAAFRPMHLASALEPKIFNQTIAGKEKAIFDITPELDAQSIEGSIDGQPIELLSHHWVYERLNSCNNVPKTLNTENGCFMPMIVAQFVRPKLEEGKHLLRVRLTDRATGEIGEGITHFVSNQKGLGF